MHTQQNPEFYWQSQSPQDIVVVPSITVDEDLLQEIKGSVHYEERQFFHLLLLQNPNTRIILVTAIPVDPCVKQYYLSMLPPHIDRCDAEKRLLSFSINDASSTRSLMTKLLERPDVISQVKQSLRVNCAMLLCFTSTKKECELAEKLGIPLFGCKQELDHWGSKSGSRTIFKEAEVPMAQGTDVTHSPAELAEKISRLHEAHSIDKVIVKLDYGFCGQGNAILDLTHMQNEAVSQDFVQDKLSRIRLCASGSSDRFLYKILKMGAIAEEFIEGGIVKSPSVQGCISFDGAVEILSTHEQVLEGFVYKGCNFPAEDPYRNELIDYGLRIGAVLARKGARGYFGVDFVVRCKSDGSSSGPSFEIFALEINLRMCGTTHPFFLMKILTGGKYAQNSGLFYGSDGQTKYYTATDSIQKSHYKGIRAREFMEMCQSRNLIFNFKSLCGPVFHLVGSLEEHGKLGVTCIGNSQEEAQSTFNRVISVLEDICAARPNT